MANCNPGKYVLLVLLSLLFLTSFNGFRDNNPSNKITRIIIDAGHGGVDPGASGLISREKDITLALALKVGKLINENLKDVTVVYTRKEDVFVDLNERSDIANKNHADLFISIHINANAKKDAYGAESYVMGMHTTEKNMEVAMKENAVITLEKDYKTKYEGYDPNSAESFIIFSLVQNMYLEQSLSMASLFQEQVKLEARRYDRGVKQAGFLVLWRTSMPSVLIEAGFISNKNEEKYLVSETGQNEIATSIYKAFARYKETLESKNGDAIVNPDTSAVSIVNDTASRHSVAEPFFSVQIFSSAKKLTGTEPDFKNCQGFAGSKEIYEFPVGNIYKYAVGQKEKYPDAQEYLKKVKQFYPDAFIIAVQNHRIIPLSEALKKKPN